MVLCGWEIHVHQPGGIDGFSGWAYVQRRLATGAGTRVSGGAAAKIKALAAEGVSDRANGLRTTRSLFLLKWRQNKMEFLRVDNWKQICYFCLVQEGRDKLRDE